MRISRIEVSNYARLADCKIEVHDHLCLVGANESGKTSLLRLIDMALRPTQLAYIRLSRIDLREASRPLVVAIRFSQLTKEETSEFCDVLTVDPDRSVPTFLDFEFRYHFESEEASDPNLTRRFGQNRIPSSATYRQLSAIGLQLLGSEDASASEAKLTGQSSAARLLLSRTEPNLGEVASDLSDSISLFNSAMCKSDVLNELVADANNQLGLLAPHKVIESPLALAHSSTQGDLLGGVNWVFRKDSIDQSLQTQSSGIRQSTLISMETLAKSNGGIICLDEPETHLQPLRQRRLGQLLASSKTQMIVSTHSPQLVSAFDPLDVVILNSKKGASQLRNRNFEFDGPMYAQWWHNEIFECLTSSRCILVEGPCDKLILQSVLRALDIDPDWRNISILQLGGADNFRAAYAILGPNGFGIPIYGLVDQDHYDDWAMEIGNDPDARIVSMDPELEDVYCRALSENGLAEVLVSRGIANAAQMLRCTGSREIEQIPPAKLARFIKADKNVNGQKQMKLKTAFVAAQLISPSNAKRFGSILELGLALSNG